MAVLGSFFMTDAMARSKSKKKTLFESAKERLASALVAAPKDQETCFSPDEPCDVKLAKLIESAQKSIDVAVFDINREQVVHQLLVASRRIPVRVLVDRRQAKGPYSGVSTLFKGGVKLRYGSQRGVMHNKFTIVDGRIVETGSFNYTTHGSEANNENQVYLANPEIVERFKKRFEEIWVEGKPIDSLPRPKGS